MLYCDFKKSSITEIQYTTGYNGDEVFIVEKTDHEGIVKAYEKYLIDRSTVYEVKLTKIDKVF